MENVEDNYVVDYCLPYTHYVDSSLTVSGKATVTWVRGDNQTVVFSISNSIIPSGYDLLNNKEFHFCLYNSRAELCYEDTTTEIINSTGRNITERGYIQFELLNETTNKLAKGNYYIEVFALDIREEDKTTIIALKDHNILHIM